jgi:hypothetical protein
MPDMESNDFVSESSLGATFNFSSISFLRASSILARSAFLSDMRSDERIDSVCTRRQEGSSSANGPGPDR